jgi:hypothetical protein
MTTALTRYEYRNVELLPDGRIRGEQRWRERENWYDFEARLDLLRISLATEVHEAAGERIWSLQDGYGEAGFTPCQGWDWSGIRDSTPEAIRSMDAVASEFVSDADLASLLGLVQG